MEVMLRAWRMAAFAAGGFLCALATPALAQSAPAQPATTGTGFWDQYIAGGWSLTLGASAAAGPAYEGAKDMGFLPSAVISLGRTGAGPAFTSRNDNPSLSVYDNGMFAIGPVGRIVWPRDSSVSNDLRGLPDVPWGVEARLYDAAKGADVHQIYWPKGR